MVDEPFIEPIPATPSKPSSSPGALGPKGEMPEGGWPGRQPRYRRAFSLYQRQKAKRFFLKLYRLSGNEELCAERTGYTLQTIKTWAKQDVLFKTEWADFSQTWKEINEGSIGNLSGKAIEILEKALDRELESKDDGRLAFDAAKAVLKSQGHLAEKAKPDPLEGNKGSVRIREVLINPPEGSPALTIARPLELSSEPELSDGNGSKP